MEKIARETGRIPKTLSDRPELRADLIDYWHGFLRLHQSRNANGTIPLTELAAWLDIIAIDDVDDRMTWVDVINAMVDEYLDWRRSIQQRQDTGRTSSRNRRH